MLACHPLLLSFSKVNDFLNEMNEPERIAATVAANLARLRRDRWLSIAELAHRSGISMGSLSAVEAGTANPTLVTLASIAEALGIGLEELVQPLFPVPHVLRSADCERSGAWGFRTVRVARFQAGPTELTLFRVQVGRPSRPSAPHPPGTIEHFLVTGGQVDAGPLEEPVLLGPGDSVRFEARIPHQYRARRTIASGILLMQRPLRA